MTASVDVLRVEEAARLMHRQFHAGDPLADSWYSCRPKMQWRKAAEALLAAIEDGTL